MFYDISSNFGVTAMLFYALLKKMITNTNLKLHRKAGL